MKRVPKIRSWKDAISGYRSKPKFKNKTAPGKTASENADKIIIEKIVEVREKLAKLKEEEIANNKFLEASDEKKKTIREKFKTYYKEYDDIVKTEDDGKITGLKTTHCIYECVQTQALISRITNKIQREEATLINTKSEEVKKDSEEIKKDSEEIKKENAKLKDSILTISSLVFMSFTFIQLNFVAFQRSSEYGVLDRIILFSGINTFVLVATYTIVLMITTLLSIDVTEEKYKLKMDFVQSKLKKIFYFFIIVFFATIGLKWLFGENSEVVTLRKSLIEKKEEIKEMNRLIKVLNLEVQNINELKIKSEQYAKDLKKELVKSEKTLEELNKYNSEEYLLKLTQSIESKVLSNIESKQLEKKEEIKLVKKQEESEVKIENEKSS